MQHWLSNEFFTAIAANLPLLSPYHAAHVNVSRNAFFNSHSQNSFFDVYIVVKNKSKSGFSWSVLLSTTSTRHYYFP